MKMLTTVLSLFVMGFFLVGLASAAEGSTERSSSAPTDPTMQKATMGSSGSAMGSDGGLPGSSAGSYASKGCCQPPSPNPERLCCGSRDCGWFACPGMGTTMPKTYKNR